MRHFKQFSVTVLVSLLLVSQAAQAARKFVFVSGPETVHNVQCQRMVFQIVNDGTNAPQPFNHAFDVQITTSNGTWVSNSSNDGCGWQDRVTVPANQSEIEFYVRAPTNASTEGTAYWYGARRHPDQTQGWVPGAQQVKRVTFSSTPPGGGNNPPPPPPSGGEGQASGAVNHYFVHRGGPSGEGVLIFRVAGKSGGPACSTAGGGLEFAFDMGVEAGHAVLSTLLYAAAQGKSVTVQGTGDCVAFGDREDARYVRLSP